MELVFWLSVGMIVYPYVLYPILVLALGSVRPRPVRAAAYQPRVSILVPAYNEEDCIAETIRNKLDLDYPKASLEIIVVSDGSSDATDDIVRAFAQDGVRLLRRASREGKAAALNEAVRHASGEIIVFSDANSLFDREAIRYMAEDFADPAIGYVTGSLQLVSGGDGLSGPGSGAYIRHENFLRRAETRLGSIIGVNGGVDAIRRSLYVDVPAELITDFVLPLTVIAEGYRVVFDPRVRSRESANEEIGREFRMRTRVALRALQGIAYMRRLLNPLRHPLAAFCLISHKVVRYFGFAFLLLALASNVWLAAGSSFYRTLLALQFAAYALGLVGFAPNLPRWLSRLTVVPTYLLMSYAAFAVAAFRFVRGDTLATWRPRAG